MVRDGIGLAEVYWNTACVLRTRPGIARMPTAETVAAIAAAATTAAPEEAATATIAAAAGCSGSSGSSSARERERETQERDLAAGEAVLHWRALCAPW